MEITKTDVVVLPLKDLHNNTGQIEGVPANPRLLRDDAYKALLRSLKEDNLTGVLPLKVYKHEGEWVVIGGNMRLRALQELKAQEVSCIVVPEDTDAATLRKIVITDNSTFGEWDMDMLANDWNTQELTDWGVELPITPEEKEQYSRKIESPIYKPTHEIAPSIDECINTEKYHELMSEIELASGISEEDKNLLRYAATRHIVFDYRNIAERYAHADKDVQRLMEKSALVIIDFVGGIENGFVRMTKRLQTLIPDEDGSTK